MQLISKPVLQFDQIPIYLGEEGEITTKEHSLKTVYFVGKATWKPITVQLESLNEIAVGQILPVFKDNEFEIYKLFLSELDHSSLRGVVYYDHAMKLN